MERFVRAVLQAQQQQQQGENGSSAEASASVPAKGSLAAAAAAGSNTPSCCCWAQWARLRERHLRWRRVVRLCERLRGEVLRLAARESPRQRREGAAQDALLAVEVTRAVRSWRERCLQRTRWRQLRRRLLLL